ncbi:hypothetical protein G6F57_016763 [Rhizopus arrhizus]|nr:hypothetical protein G6F57_016763 [Rhizopus arrhizus]
MAVDDLALLVDQIDRRPVLVAIGLPRGITVVLRHRVRDLEAFQRLLDVGRRTLERELRRVHAHHDQALVLVLLMPAGDVRQRADAIDAGVRPELHQHDLST